MKSWQVGVVGCGSVCPRYLELLAGTPSVSIAAVWDVDGVRRDAIAGACGAEAKPSFESLLDDRQIDVVLNLTPPACHFEVTRAALLAGKHVYSEKPLALRAEEADELTGLARQRSLRLGCAPDTFFAPPFKAARDAIQGGQIGRITGACAAMLCRGHEWWHPRPDYYYAPGAGPLWDMGPYYITVLEDLLGPVHRVSAMSSTALAARVVKADGGERSIPVRTPTHLCALLQFSSGVVATLTTSFDVWVPEASRFEVYGTEGTLRLPDPNLHQGTVRAWSPPKTGPWRNHEWGEIHQGRQVDGVARGWGLLEMLSALEQGRPHSADGVRASRVVRVLAALSRSAHVRAEVEV